MNISDFYEKNKKAVLIVGFNAAGILILIGFICLLRRVTVGPVPQPEQASAPQVVGYIASKQMNLLPESTRVDLVTRTIDYYTGAPERLEQFDQGLRTLSDSQFEQFKENTYQVAADLIKRDAEEYGALRDPRDKRAYLQSRVQKMSGLRSMVTGRSGPTGGGGGYGGGNRGGGGGGGGGKGSGLMNNQRLIAAAQGNPQEMYRNVISNSSPKDRGKMENYIMDMHNFTQQLQRTRR